MVEIDQQSVYHRTVCLQEGEGEETASTFCCIRQMMKFFEEKTLDLQRIFFFCSFGLFFCRVFVACEGKSKHAAIVQMDVFTFNYGVHENKVCNMLLPAYLKGVVLALV